MSAKKISRRQFVASTVSAAAISSLPARRAVARILEPSGVLDSPTWKDQGILNLTKSPHAKLRNVPVHAVTVTSGFWAQRRETNGNRSIPSMEKLLEANGRMDNFLRLAGKSDAPQRGPVYSDSDVYKWI